LEQPERQQQQQQQRRQAGSSVKRQQQAQGYNINRPSNRRQAHSLVRHHKNMYQQQALCTLTNRHVAVMQLLQAAVCSRCAAGTSPCTACISLCRSFLLLLLPQLLLPHSSAMAGAQKVLRQALPPTYSWMLTVRPSGALGL
jgi:hypothetical protein